MLDQKSDIKVENALDVTAISSNGTTPGEIIDMQGYESCTFLLRAGSLTDGAYTPKIEHGDEDDLSDAAEVADAQLVGTEAAAALADTDDNAVKTVGYVGGKRYVRMSVVAASVTSGGTVCGEVVKGHARTKPAA